MHSEFMIFIDFLNERIAFNIKNSKIASNLASS